MPPTHIVALCLSPLAVTAFLLMLCSRKMLLVHGTRKQVKAGFLWALCSLIRMYFGGYSNTLFVNPRCTVKTRTEEREMRKNKPGKRVYPSRTVMIFEVEL